jgi:hypothetical protein
MADAVEKGDEGVKFNPPPRPGQGYILNFVSIAGCREYQ